MNASLKWRKRKSGIPKSRELRERFAERQRSESFGPITEKMRAIDRQRQAEGDAEMRGLGGLFGDRNAVGG